MSDRERVKDLLAKEHNTIKHALTISDRRLLKCYFGFTKCVQIPTFPTRDKTTACDLVKRVLFNDQSDGETGKRVDGEENSEAKKAASKSGKTEKAASNTVGNEKFVENDEEAFDLTSLLQKDVPTIFSWSVENLQQLFLQGSQFTDNQQMAVIRAFTSFDRIYPHDVALSSAYVRLLLVGPVKYIVKKMKLKFYVDL